MGRRRFPGPRLLSVLPWHCVAAAVILAFHWLALFAAYKRAPAGTVILLVYLAPVGIAAVALNLAMNLAFMIPLQHIGPALATSLAAIFNVGWLAVVLMRRGHLDIDRKLKERLARMLAATARKTSRTSTGRGRNKPKPSVYSSYSGRPINTV